METNGDTELVDLARGGSRQAYDELIRRHQRCAWGLACTLVGDRFEAQDIAQEAFLRAWLNFDLLSDPARFSGWLRRIVFGVSIDWLRVFRPDLYRMGGVETEQQLYAHCSSSQSALARLEEVELRHRVWDAVRHLPERYRLPLTLFHLDGLSQAKVAEALGVPEGTVRSLVSRARQKLETMLSEYAVEVLPALEDVFKEQRKRPSEMVHIADGDSVVGTLRRSGLPGVVMVCGDLLYEGPALQGVSPSVWQQSRATFIRDAGYATLGDAERFVEAADRALASYRDHDEVSLWLDHRLSDQLILIRALDWYSRQDLGTTRLSLICLGRYPGLEPFIGLGQLKPDQMASLADTRVRVNEAQFRLARAAWDAFTAPDPTAIESLAGAGTPALPFLSAALRRHLQQFPAVENGLSRTEGQALSVLRERGSLTARDLFVAVQNAEELLFMGDSSFFRMMRGLATASHPLVQVVDPGAPFEQWATMPVELTCAGIAVVEGQNDHVRLNGIDRWVGGVHLEGGGAWRWDDSAGRIRKMNVFS